MISSGKPSAIDKYQLGMVRSAREKWSWHGRWLMEMIDLKIDDTEKCVDSPPKKNGRLPIRNDS